MKTNKDNQVIRGTTGIKRISITKEGFEKLKTDMAALQAERPQAVKNLAEARGMGDLSENGLYTAAKSRLRSIDSQLFRLDIQIKLADIIEPTQKGIIGIDSKVVIEVDGEKRNVHVVGDYEANPMEGKVSQKSPIGSALMGKSVGDIAFYTVPAGTIQCKVLSIE